MRVDCRTARRFSVAGGWPLKVRPYSSDAPGARGATAIERFQEHRAALIIAAVTGKLNVRGPVHETTALS